MMSKKILIMQGSIAEIFQKHKISIHFGAIHLGRPAYPGEGGS